MEALCSSEGKQAGEQMSGCTTVGFQVKVLTQPCPSTHIKTVNIRVVISIKSFSLLSEKELLLPKLSESHQKEQHKVHCADTHCIPPREACCAVTDQDWCLLPTEPTFVSASWVKRKEDPENEKIYIFFREKNSDQNPEADPWISRVARVCKVPWTKHTVIQMAWGET